MTMKKHQTGKSSETHESNGSGIGSDGHVHDLNTMGDSGQGQVVEHGAGVKIPAKGSKPSTWLRSRFNTPAAPGLVYAGFWYRLLALMIDYTLSLAIALASITLVQLVAPSGIPVLNTVVWNTAALLSIQLLYFVALEQSSWKGTLGKRLLKLRVTDTRGQRLGPIRSLCRNLLKLSMPLTFGGVALWIFFTAKHQTLYDKACGTVVLRKTSETFIPKWMPSAMQSSHWFIVVAISALMSTMTMRTVISVTTPRLDLITLQLLVAESLSELVPVQKTIEQAFAKDGKYPERIEPAKLLANNLRKQFYQPSNGSVSAIFESGKLKNSGLLLTPTVDPTSKEIVWACAAINLTADLTPRHCAPSAVVR